MIKSKGDRKVETWEHQRSGVTCDIYLRGTKFVAVLLEKEFDAPDIAILRHQLRDYAEHWLSMKWFPLIKIDTGADRYNSQGDQRADLKITIERFLVSASPAGQWFSVGWAVDPAHRKSEMSDYSENRYGRGGMGSRLNIIGLPLKAPLKTSDDTYLMDYTEELWDKLFAIVQGVHALRKKISDLVSSKKGLESLLLGGGEQLLLK